MKKCLIQVISLCLLMSLMLSLMVPASAAITPGSDAEIQASNYFVSEKAAITAAGNGKIAIEIDVRGTSEMKELGASDVYVYEVQSDGRYTQMAHYTRDKFSVLIKTNVLRANIQLTYQGTAGKKYYVEAKCYAKNSSGSGTRWVSSSIITAT